MADDPLALLTAQEAYEAINDPTSAAATSPDRDPEFIGIWVPAISRRIDELCGPVVIRTVTDERHDGGRARIWLDHSPAASVTTLVEYASGAATTLTAEQDDTLPADGYLIDGGSVFRRSNGSDVLFAAGRRNVKITYEAGRYATTAAVDAKFKLAAGNILTGLWKKYASAWSSGSSDPFAEIVPSRRLFNELDHEVKKYLGGELVAPAVA